MAVVGEAATADASSNLTTAAAAAAYAFALFGKPCTLRHQCELIASISLLQRTRPAFPIVAMLAGDCWSDRALGSELQLLQVLRVRVPTIGPPHCANIAQPNKERWAQSYTIANVSCDQHPHIRSAAGVKAVVLIDCFLTIC